jgi:DNA replication and repair protein RecF
LLEAISLLTPGRGLRRAPYADVAREGSVGGFAVHAQLDGAKGTFDIGTGTAGLDLGSEAGRRVRINSTQTSADELLDWLRVLWITPAMDALFTGPAGDRRRFLDRLVLAIDPGHGRRAQDYEKAMRGRNRLLSEGSRDRAWFDAIELQMVESGTAIAAARAEMVRLLAAMIDKLPASPFPHADLALAGSLEAMVGHAPAVEIEESFRQALASGRERDRAAGRTLDGPHRSDLVPNPCRPSSARLESRRPCSSASCFRMPVSPAKCRATCRSCCWTRSLRISMPAAAPRCSRSSKSSAARPS